MTKKKQDVHLLIDPELFEDLKTAADRLSKERKIRVSHNMAITEALVEWVKRILSK